MSRRDALLLLLLSAIWGSSFIFIKLGVDELEPSVVVLGRLVFGALFLTLLLPGRGGLGPLRGHLVPLVVLGTLNNAIPFWLLGFAETRLPAGLTAVIQASAPIFTVLLALGSTSASASEERGSAGSRSASSGSHCSSGSNAATTSSRRSPCSVSLSVTRARSSTPAAPCAESRRCNSRSGSSCARRC